MARTLVASDNFNRAGPGLGSDWAQLDNAGGGDVVIAGSVTIAGSFSASSNRPACARWVGAGSFTSDQYSSVRVVNGSAAIGGTQWAGVIVCASADTDANRDMYLAYKQLSGVSNNVVLAKAVNGTYTTIFSGTQSLADNDLLSLEREGTTLRVCLNGTPLGGGWTVTDTDLSGGAPGVLGTDSAVMDDWEGGNITGGGGIIPLLMQLFRFWRH